MKAFIAFVVLLLVAVAGGVGYLAWEKWTKVEEWGVGLMLDNPIEKDEIEMVAARYNEILDRDEVLSNAVEKHNLTSYYEVSSSEEAVALLREDSFVKLPGGRNIHVLFRGKRSTRETREAVIRTLAEDFVKVSQGMGASQ